MLKLFGNDAGGVKGEKINATCLIFILKTRFSRIYKAPNEIHQNINITKIGPDLKKVSNETLQELYEKFPEED